ncbi:DUF1564 domain-containing protein [Leptospira interrogans]|uniref:PF07600 family protein n=1 Tax=Leptospira interrogans serogroup Icterohaemorrhagiae serovar Lai (strain 56601) TaxID=189518 RepID=Q8F3B9_LEPIN|nr:MULTISPECIES: DUF1564 domain-containing protein [Leptospira]AAN49687.1 conserved hypothetical protein [Leptospira interrogans serovar Lai str. 56601]AER02831.1 conserved hypothetical protein [Leptospira interrogans serovar Lai str. IPAV]EKR18683.1 PF07600 family protein [Leptospira interrogans serovar Pyrogenes str. 2006006960]WML95463.1 DUF1564 domain-containing protein [Leptospira interrogans]
MGVLLLNSDHKILSTFQEDQTNVVTLLIPEDTLLLYPEKERKNLPKRIPQLLKIYGKYLSSANRLGKKAGKTMYQNSPGRKKLKKINVRMNTKNWVLLGVFSQSHGVSRCFLFNYLLWLDRIGVGNSIVSTINEGVPTFQRNYSYILNLDLLNNQISRVLKCDPENYFNVLNHQDWFDS